MRNFVTHYIRNCHICSQSKSQRHNKYSILKLLPILTQWWKDISMNFVINLPISEGYDAVLMMIDWLTKMRHFISMHTTTITETVADLYVNHIYCLHEFFDMIVSDWEPQFAALFWKLLCQRLSISQLLSTAFHSETDEQTEINNASMKVYLNTYTAY